MGKQLITDYDCQVEDPFTLGLPGWEGTIEVRKENFKNRQTGKRAALIYWTKDDKRELIVNSFIEDGVKYKWNFKPAKKEWAAYNYDSAL